MARAPVDVRAGTEVRVTGASAVQPQPQPPPPEPDVEQVRVDPKRRITNYEILEHTANTLDAASGMATQVGAEGVADVTHEAAKVARTIQPAVEGIKREAKPLVKAGQGLWSALERRGVVAVREPVNFAAMQKGRGPDGKKQKVER